MVDETEIKDNLTNSQGSLYTISDYIDRDFIPNFPSTITMCYYTENRDNCLDQGPNLAYRDIGIDSII